MAGTKKIDRNTKKKASAVKVSEKKAGFRPSEIKKFGLEVKNEFNKIAWPKRKQTIGSTIVVTVFVTFIAIYLGAVDLFLGKLIGIILQ